VLPLPAVIEPAADGIHDKDKRDEGEPLAPWGAAGSFIARHARYSQWLVPRARESFEGEGD